MKEEKVYLLIYSHNHGKDYNVFISYDLAYKGALEFIKDYREDFEIIELGLIKE